MYRISSPTCQHWQYIYVLRPNCSMSWRETLFFYLFVCGVSGTIGITMAVMGFWMILPFAGLELLVLGMLLYKVVCHCHQQEVVYIGHDIVRIEKGMRQPWKHQDLIRAFTHVHLNDRSSRQRRLSSLTLSMHNQSIELGTFLNEEERQHLANELRDCLRIVPLHRAA